MTAAVLASRGMRTLLVDRARFPRHKLCGGCLAPAGLQVLRRLEIANHVPRIGALRLESLRIIARAVAHDLPIKLYTAVDRASLDHAICQAATARGAEFRDAVTARVLPDDTIRLEHNGQSEVLRPRVIVVADGVGGSALSERTEFAPRVRKHSVIGVGTQLPHRPAYAKPDAITMVCAQAGYVGAAPSGTGHWSLAAALHPAAVRTHGPVETLRQLLAESGLHPPELAKAQLRGVGNLTRQRRCAAGRVLVVGDAASYFQPLTGEGMSWAMACAEQIWPHAQAAARGEDVSRSWQAACTRTLRTRHLMCRAVCTLAAHPQAMRCMLLAGRATPAMGWLSRRLCWSPA